MKKHFFLLCFLLSALTLFSGGCAHSLPEDPPSEKRTVPEQELTALGGSLLYAIQHGQYKKLALLLKKHHGPEIDHQQFISTRKAFIHQFGQIRSYRYLTELKTPLVKNLLWVVVCKREDENTEQQCRELLFRLVTVQDGRKIRIIGMGFF